MFSLCMCGSKIPILPNAVWKHAFGNLINSPEDNSKFSFGVTASEVGWLSLVEGVTFRRQLGCIPASSVTSSAGKLISHLWVSVQ